MNKLVLCTGNSARSLLLESILNHQGVGRIKVYSAGSKPVGQVNPAALVQLKAVGVPFAGVRSKSWDEFAGSDAQQMNIVIIVSGGAQDETCPIWPGAPLNAHWSIENPADVTEPGEAVREAFSKAYIQLCKCTEAFLALPIEDMVRRE